jgi:ankyrin repeat protein
MRGQLGRNTLVNLFKKLFGSSQVPTRRVVSTPVPELVSDGDDVGRPADGTAKLAGHDRSETPAITAVVPVEAVDPGPSMPRPAARLPRGVGAESLIRAASAGDVVSLKQLIEQGVDVNGQAVCLGQFEPVTALEMAALGGRPHAIEILLEAGADPMKSGRRNGNIPAYTAILMHEQPDDSLLATFISHGTDANWVNAEGGASLLACACARASAAFHVPLLLQRGADPYRRDRWDDNALEHAIHWGLNEGVKALIASGVDLHGKTSDGRSMLQLAKTAKKPSPEVVQMLIDAGVQE